MKAINHLDLKQLVNDTQVASKISNEIQQLWDSCSCDVANLVFIDADVEDKEVLLHGLLPSYQAVILSADQDGVEQITYVLSEFKDVESIHIVSHGNPGTLFLGSTQLDLGVISRYQDQLKGWSDALSANAKVLLYGCRVAEGSIGSAFVQRLHEVLGAAIAASTTPIGHPNKAGNWQLDAQMGVVKFSPAFKLEAMQNFPGTLQNLDLSTGDINHPFGDGAESAGSASSAASLLDSSESGPNLLFVDAAVDDYQSLLDSVTEETEVFILNEQLDGITQISSILANYSNVSSLQIVSHGASGSLQLGSSTVSSGNLGEYQDELTGWSQFLNSEADILLYGCDVAQGEIGQGFVAQLSILTGADIAASNDLTGSTTLGGDWDLEVVMGVIETETSFSQQGLDEYVGLLETLVVTNQADDSISLYATNGLGGFEPPTTFSVGGTSPTTVVLGDINGDGLEDAVTTDEGSNSISLLINDGAGGFL
ncbi:MAG: DUF4347 domain-containing protein, partial [Cyanobacteria bacterium J06639_16]